MKCHLPGSGGATQAEPRTKSQAGVSRPRAPKAQLQMCRPAHDIVQSTMPKSLSKSFRAMLEPDGTNLKWVIIHVPLDVVRIWGSRGMLKVKGEINGFAFRTSLFPTGKGGHTLLVNKRMQAGAKAVAGTTAQFRLEPDTEKRTVTVPPELQRILNEDRAFRRWFEKLNDSTRKWVTDWITNVKSAVARLRRAEQVAEQLLSTMEAEQELPPALQRRLPPGSLAHEGWNRMSQTRRRGHLLAIFYYRNPESRARRIETMLIEAEAAAKRKKNPSVET
jgi:uncharacterized protein YdeI (YjbR/CyaY-like superfamily)